MRYSRLKRKKTKQRYAAFFLITALLLGGLYLAFAGTAGKFISDIISPIFGLIDRDGQGDTSQGTPQLTIPDNNKDTVKITDTIKAAPLNMKAIQMGAFTERENAEVEKVMQQNRGGAGYILDDTYYRVLAMGFISEEDALKVREQLKEDGIESQVYSIKAPGANMQITATETNVTVIKRAFFVWEEKYEAIEVVIKDLDSGKITSSVAYDRVKSYRDTLLEVKDELSDITSNQENNTILTGLLELYEKGCNSFGDTLSENPSNMVAISAKMKYTYINMIVQYKYYMEQILKL